MAEFVEVIKQMKRMCDNFNSCSSCPITRVCDATILRMLNEAEDVERTIIEWNKEHPVKTNLDKLREVFPDVNFIEEMIHSCTGIRCTDDTNCNECKNHNFWQKEYEEKKENK